MERFRIKSERKYVMLRVKEDGDLNVTSMQWRFILYTYSYTDSVEITSELSLWKILTMNRNYNTKRKTLVSRKGDTFQYR